MALKPIYTEMVAQSLPLWEALARETGRTLYTETGVLRSAMPKTATHCPAST